MGDGHPFGGFVLLSIQTVALVVILLASLVYIAIHELRKKELQQVVGFFHPFTNDGGGGERVLWCAVRAVQEQLPGIKTVIYTGDPATSQSLRDRAFQLFGVQLPSPPQVAHLGKRRWVEASMYPRFTLIGQSLGSIILGWEALTKQKPVLFVDTSGYAFVYPLARAVGCKVACYTHYPTISSEMVSRVVNRVSMYNNKGTVSRSFWLSMGKACYYRVMAWMYGFAGSYADLAMVNSSWTESHITKLWGITERIVRIYPPCDTLSLQALPLERGEKNLCIISVAQFRPEKAHEMQLQAFARALERWMSEGGQSYASGKPRLKLVGSCRHREDEKRLESLQFQCSQLGIEDYVEICKNVSYSELKSLLGGAAAGLHTMIDEHFGISVVEYMAAGAVPIAHNSGGPKLDIMRCEDGLQTGFLAVTVEEFADAIYTVICMPESERLRIAAAARQRAAQFSQASFDVNFKAALQPLALQLDLLDSLRE